MACSRLVLWSVGDIVLSVKNLAPQQFGAQAICYYSRETGTFKLDHFVISGDPGEEQFSELKNQWWVDQIVFHARQKLGVAWGSAVFVAEVTDDAVSYRVGSHSEYSGYKKDSLEESENIEPSE